MTADRDLISSNIEAYLTRYQEKELLRFVAVGSVDDGKSTLIGRLLFDTGSVYKDQLEAVRKATNIEGTEIDLSLLTDGLAAEREQGITIDVAYRYFSTEKRKFIIADTPGHVQYTRNMVTGASTANVAIILIDARLGVLEQSRRHAYIASLLGIPRLAVCVNKMDLVAYDRSVFTRIEADFSAFTKNLSFAGVRFFPISALTGANCVHRTASIPWYEGPTVLEFLETVPIREERDFEHFRFPVQYVLRPNLDYRGFAGRIASGVVAKGDSVVVLPSGKASRIRSIDTFEGELPEAFAPRSVTLRLEDEIDVSRGDMIVGVHGMPRMTRTFDAHIVWMHEDPLDINKTYLLKHTTQTVRAAVEHVHWRKDMDTLDERPADTLGLNDIGRVTVTAHRPLFLDAYTENRVTGSFILIDAIANSTVAAGMAVWPTMAPTPRSRSGPPSESTADLRPTSDRPAADTENAGSLIGPAERTARTGTHGGAVLVVGPLPLAERFAYAVERRLFDCGAIAVVLAGASTAELLTAANAVARAGVLAVVAIAPTSRDDTSSLGRPPRRIVVRVGVRAAGPTDASGTEEATLDLADTPEGEGVGAVIAVLRERGWLEKRGGSL